MFRLYYVHLILYFLNSFLYLCVYVDKIRFIIVVKIKADLRLARINNLFIFKNVLILKASKYILSNSVFFYSFHFYILNFCKD